MKRRSDWDDYELPAEYDFAGKEAVRGRFYSPKKVSVTIRLTELPPAVSAGSRFGGSIA